MNAKYIVRMCIVVLGTALCLQTTAVMAEIVTAEQRGPQSQIEAERLKVQSFMDRAEVKDQLQALGVLESVSKVRVAAMTDEEVHTLAQKIDTMPAGGRGLRDSDLVVVLLLVILLILLI
jgi:hypothetical protein